MFRQRRLGTRPATMTEMERDGLRRNGEVLLRVGDVAVDGRSRGRTGLRSVLLGALANDVARQHEVVEERRHA